MTVSEKQNRMGWCSGRHLSMIFFCGFMYFFNTIFTAGSTNTVFPLLSQLNGWDNSKILVTMTICGYIGAVFILFTGTLVMKKGAKLIAVIGLFGTAITAMLWGVVKSLPVFIAILIIQRIFIVGFNNGANPTLVSAWWPRKKGIVLGWATMGIVLSDIIWSPYIPTIIGKIGATKTFILAGIIVAVFAVLVCIFVKNTPEELNKYPDGMQEGAQDAREAAKAFKAYKSDWTVGKVLKTKQAWLIIFGFGLLWMSAAMFLNQIVPRVLTLGYELSFGVKVMQAAAIAALFGSWFLGFLDQKIGTKKTSIIFAVWQTVMFAMGLLQHQGMLFIWISALGMMAGVGGIANLIPSIMIGIWGRHDFVAVNRVISFVMDLIRCSSFALITVFLKTPWGFDAMYVAGGIFSLICVFLIISIKTNFLGKKDAELTAKAQ